MRLRWPLVVLGSIPLLQADPIWAQSSTLPDEPYCDCRIDFEHVVTLGTFDGPGALPGSIRQVARGWDGGYYLVPWQEPVIYRFEADGTPVGTFGRAGEGPGEFGNIARITFVEDSLLVWDRGNARLSVFDSNLELHRTMPLEAHIEHGVPLPDGGYLVNGIIADGGDGWAPLRILTQDGVIAHSLGDRVTDRGQQPRRWLRMLASGREGAWSAHGTEYSLRYWNSTGTRLQELIREADWLVPYGDGSWGPDQPKPSRVVDVIVDQGGNIRTLVRRATARWKELLPPPIHRAGRTVYPTPSGIGLFETVVETIDPRGRRLIAQGLFESDLFGFVDAETAFRYREDEIGVPTVEIWRFTLEPGEGH
jgi:hypothetical protein